jgi:hypothetical protein
MASSFYRNVPIPCIAVLICVQRSTPVQKQGHLNAGRGTQGGF